MVPIPKGGEGGIVPSPSVLVPELAFGSVPTVALSSAQVWDVASRTAAASSYQDMPSQIKHFYRWHDSVTFSDEATRAGKDNCRRSHRSVETWRENLLGISA